MLANYIGVWWEMFFVSVKIRNQWEILPGQHCTNAGDKFVNRVKVVESEWVSVLGRTLCPIFYRKMPLRLAKRRSAGFQDKESKPQVMNVMHCTKLPVWWQSSTCNPWYCYCRMKYEWNCSKAADSLRENTKEGYFRTTPYSFMISSLRSRHTFKFLVE